MRRGPLLALSLALAAASCASPDGGSVAGRAPTATATSTTTGIAQTTTSTLSTSPRPAWLGRRALPLRPDGLGEIQPTPPELVDRRFATIDLLPPPVDDDFSSSVTEPPADVIARSTWTDACPVAVADLRYLTVSFWGFDGLAHTGELLVHRDAVDVMVSGFEALFRRRFPIEEMRVVRADELDVPPTGDGNNTSAFVCRPSVGSTSWSQHAFGRAVDINPFHNPYVRDDVVIPELASWYVDRPERPGVVTGDDVEGFVSGGWGWGGRWQSSKDWMHVSANGR
ncbi:M15 family metallopeptidase [Actinospongicola halichondriae]|uniref:M15 family metallopeptidase n=1 Tax=Actinospongicola halichondriae TaxID=3236844 RepID=UPI003D5174CA